MRSFASICCALALLCACKKDRKNTIDANQLRVSKVTHLSADHSSATDVFYTYDITSRLTKEAADVYLYEKGKVTCTNAAGYVTTFYLGNKGMADSCVIAKPGGMGLAIIESYQYDHEGYLIERKNYAGGAPTLLLQVTKFTIEAGNPVMQRDYDATGNLLSENTLTYDLGHTNTIGHENFGRRFLGDQAEHSASFRINTAGQRPSSIS